MPFARIGGGTSATRMAQGGRAANQIRATARVPSTRSRWSLEYAQENNILAVSSTEELYDHDSDPWEWNNLAGSPAYANVIGEFQKWLPAGELPH